LRWVGFFGGLPPPAYEDALQPANSCNRDGKEHDDADQLRFILLSLQRDVGDYSPVGGTAGFRLRQSRNLPVFLDRTEMPLARYIAHAVLPSKLIVGAIDSGLTVVFQTTSDVFNRPIDRFFRDNLLPACHACE